MNTVYGCTVFMLPQSTQRAQRIQYRLSHRYYSPLPSALLASSAVYFIKRRARKDRKDFCKGYLFNFPQFPLRS